MKVLLYAEAYVASREGVTQPRASSQIMLDNGDTDVAWTEIIAARENVRTLITDLLHDLGYSVDQIEITTDPPRKFGP